MSTVIVSATVKPLEVPLSVKVQGYKIEVTGLVAQIVAVPTASFNDVGPGDYTASVSLIDADGLVIGDPQSAKFTVLPAVQSVSVPDVVTVVVS